MGKPIAFYLLPLYILDMKSFYDTEARTLVRKCGKPVLVRDETCIGEYLEVPWYFRVYPFHNPRPPYNDTTASARFSPLTSAGLEMLLTKKAEGKRVELIIGETMPHSIPRTFDYLSDRFTRGQMKIGLKSSFKKLSEKSGLLEEPNPETNPYLFIIPDDVLNNRMVPKPVTLSGLF
jgi:hypothetical protein